MRENVESFCCDAIVESFAGLLDYRSQGKEPVDEVQGKCAGLGTINSTVLTCEYMKNHGICIKSIILNNYHSDSKMEIDNNRAF